MDSDGGSKDGSRRRHRGERRRGVCPGRLASDRKRCWFCVASSVTPHRARLLARVLQELLGPVRASSEQQPGWRDGEVSRRHLQLLAACIGNVLVARRRVAVDSPPLSRLRLMHTFQGLVMPLAVIITASLFAATSAKGFAVVQRELTFKTPSGNIRCDLYAFDGRTDYATCAVRSTAAVSPRCPYANVPCPLVYEVHGVGGVDINRGAYMVGAERVLAYGRQLRIGVISCASRFAGLTCRSLRSGHGFFLSRQSQRTF